MILIKRLKGKRDTAFYNARSVWSHELTVSTLVKLLQTWSKYFNNILYTALWPNYFLFLLHNVYHTCKFKHRTSGMLRWWSIAWAALKETAKQTPFFNRGKTTGLLANALQRFWLNGYKIYERNQINHCGVWSDDLVSCGWRHSINI